MHEVDNFSVSLEIAREGPPLQLNIGILPSIAWNCGDIGGEFKVSPAIFKTFKAIVLRALRNKNNHMNWPASRLEILRMTGSDNMESTIDVHVVRLRHTFSTELPEKLGITDKSIIARSRFAFGLAAGVTINDTALGQTVDDALILALRSTGALFIGNGASNASNALGQVIVTGLENLKAKNLDKETAVALAGLASIVTSWLQRHSQNQDLLGRAERQFRIFMRAVEQFGERGSRATEFTIEALKKAGIETNKLPPFHPQTPLSNLTSLSHRAALKPTR